MPELIWDGKYDSTGKRIAPLRVALPFQTVETVNESSQERQRSLFFTDGQNTEWRNRLIWGDKKYVLPSLLPDFEEAIDLIYIDPPFATGDNFSLQIELDGDSFTRQANVIEQRAYRDTWSRGLDGYTSWMFETVSLLRDLLSENGVLAIHLDWRMSPVIRLILDELFGRDSFVNELIWRYGKMSNPSRRFARSHDQIMVYSKGEQYTFNAQAEETSEYRNRYERWIGEDNVLRYGAVAASADKLIALRVRKIERQLGRSLSADDVLFDFNDERKVLDDVFTDISIVKGNSSERTAYPTQKPEALLQRVIGAFSNEGDLVLDCFCGSGTTAVAAEKLNRRWIVADLGRFAIHTTRKRLLSIPDVRPFVVQNLGKYERQLWQAAEFGESATARTSAYRSFILDLYHATPTHTYAWLHGLKSGRMVHVGTVDAPVTNGDVE
jgi:adenine specific DNA methylase Mod